MLGYLRRILPENSFVRRWYSALAAALAAVYYGFPAKQLTVLGVTGTDGKTTTTEMLAHILRAEGKKVCSVSTAHTFLGDNEIADDKRTTPSPWRLQQLLRQATKEGIEYVVLEVSSHAIAQKRIFGIRFDVAVFTNISPEHLDYHKTMEDYSKTKKMLFTKLLKHTGAAVINIDDEFGHSWLPEIEQLGRRVFTYSTRAAAEAFLKGNEIAQRENGVGCLLQDDKGKSVGKLFLPMFGAFNIENAMAAMLAALQLKISLAESSKSLAHFGGIPGRMEEIESGQDFSIFVDFAVTPGALKKLLLSARQMVDDKRVIIVFGCAGNHPDTSVRQELGRQAAKHADVIIITDDEPYFEDPAEIRELILDGVQYELGTEGESGKIVREIADRQTAIETALQMAAPGDIVLVSGMGHLESRNFGGNELKWNDKAVIQSVLNTFAE